MLEQGDVGPGLPSRLAIERRAHRRSVPGRGGQRKGASPTRKLPAESSLELRTALVHISLMAERAEIVQGPWGAPKRSDTASSAPTGATATPDKVVLGMVVRACVVELGHEPSPRELADWANHQRDSRGDFCMFGREISDAEAAVILKNPGREVTVRPARAAPKPGLGLVVVPSRSRD